MVKGNAYLNYSTHYIRRACYVSKTNSNNDYIEIVLTNSFMAALAP